MSENLNNSAIPPELEAILNGKAPIHIDKTLDQRIIDWNRKRNNLYFDIDLELRMLQEEAQEFFTADNLVERLQEYSDFIFVYAGTLAKYMASKSTTVEQFRQTHDLMAELQTWAENILSYTGQILRRELSLLAPDDETQTNILTRALEAVVKANEAKGIEKDENGKVKKGPNYVKPTDAINEIIKKQTGRYVQ